MYSLEKNKENVHGRIERKMEKEVGKKQKGERSKHAQRKIKKTTEAIEGNARREKEKRTKRGIRMQKECKEKM